MTRIQTETGITFPTPERITKEDAADVHNLTLLLDGETLSVKPAEQLLTVESHGARELIEAAKDPSPIDLEDDLNWTILGEEIPLGPCVAQMTLRRGRLRG
ncbi:hypothetical protein [Dactylosporangium sp. CS-033363]|uniref:hypothetical protein n=1 Tax=Dactylosporangium sp. CS-033363 TaxID=3239935 RepID=UPI003D919AC6